MRCPCTHGKNSICCLYTAVHPCFNWKPENRFNQSIGTLEAFCLVLYPPGQPTTCPTIQPSNHCLSVGCILDRPHYEAEHRSARTNVPSSAWQQLLDRHLEAIESNEFTGKPTGCNDPNSKKPSRVTSRQQPNQVTTKSQLPSFSYQCGNLLEAGFKRARYDLVVLLSWVVRSSRLFANLMLPMTELMEVVSHVHPFYLVPYSESRRYVIHHVPVCPTSISHPGLPDVPSCWVMVSTVLIRS